MIWLPRGAIDRPGAEAPEGVAAVIFDLDGTLFDHSKAATRGVLDLVNQLGGRFTPELGAHWFDAESRHMRSWNLGRCSWREQRRRRLREFLPLAGIAGDINEAELDQIFERYLHGYEESWSAFPDAAPAINAVRRAGYQVAVLTSGKREQQVAKLERIGLMNLVGPVWASDDVGVAKPEPRSFLTVCEKLGVVPARAVYVGDNFAQDVVGATGAGLRAVFLDRLDDGAAEYEPRIATLHPLSEVLVQFVG